MDLWFIETLEGRPRKPKKYARKAKTPRRSVAFAKRFLFSGGVFDLFGLPSVCVCFLFVKTRTLNVVWFLVLLFSVVSIKQTKTKAIQVFGCYYKGTNTCRKKGREKTKKNSREPRTNNPFAKPQFLLRVLAFSWCVSPLGLLVV